MSLTNADLAELLAVRSADETGNKQKALRRASRKAFGWPVEVSSLVEQGLSPTQLDGVGPYLARILEDWLSDPPPLPATAPERSDFMTMSEARTLLDGSPGWRQVYGDLQMHSTWSDGYGSIEELAQAAAVLDYRYISITDHSKGLKIAGGIDEDQLAEQALEIRAANEAVPGVRVLCSLELNISPEGREDMDPAALAQLDIVVGSFHSQLRKKEDQTERYLAALRNPHFQIFGHPKGRIYNFRAGLSADWARVFAAGEAAGKAFEINAFPDRQDLQSKLLAIARDSGVMISIGTDAHHPSQLGFIDIALGNALKAGIPKERVLNFMDLETLLDWVAESRARYSPAST